MNYQYHPVLTPQYIYTGVIFIGIGIYGVYEAIQLAGAIQVAAFSNMPLIIGGGGAFLILVGAILAYIGMKQYGQKQAIPNTQQTTPPQSGSRLSWILTILFIVIAVIAVISKFYFVYVPSFQGSDRVIQQSQ